MKIAEQNSTELKLTDSAGCLWIFGLFFIIMGGIFISGLLGMFQNLDELSNLEKLGAWIISLGGFLAGVYLIYQNPGSGILFDRGNNKLIITRTGLFRNQKEEYGLNEIKDIVLTKSTDTDGDPVYRVEAELKTGKLIPLSILWLQNKEVMEDKIKTIRDFLK
ncbi:MAG: hypothetical protein KGZ85_04035 [Ignavibacterium sp.]|nr:hypothetical protein [Ignavibacterium sp.]